VQTFFIFFYFYTTLVIKTIVFQAFIYSYFLKKII
jgi:hypothetical protein